VRTDAKPSETGRGVHIVMVDGRVVLAAGRLTTVDEAAFRAELAEVMQTVDKDYEQIVARHKAAIPYLLEANRNLRSASLGVTRLIGDSV
jgi:5-methylthioadenosine/S-adenosylhomocysteine deaminase